MTRHPEISHFLSLAGGPIFGVHLTERNKNTDEILETDGKFRDPVKWDKDTEKLYDGNHRLKSASEKGKAVDVQKVDRWGIDVEEPKD